MKPDIKVFFIAIVIITFYTVYNVKFNIARKIVKISKQLNKTKLKIYDYGCGSGEFLKDVENIIKIIKPDINLDILGYDIKNYNKYYNCSTKLSKDNYDIKLCSYCIHHIKSCNHSEVIKYLTTNCTYTVIIEDERRFMNMCKKHLTTSDYISNYTDVKNQFYTKKELLDILHKHCKKIVYSNTIYLKFPLQRSRLLKDKFYYNPTTIIITNNKGILNAKRVK